MEAMMRESGNCRDAPRLDFETWRALLRSICGRYNPEGVEPSAFSGWACPLTVCGFRALDFGGNAPRIERTYRDVRLDSVDSYAVLFQVAGRSTIAQNDQIVQITMGGDVALVDRARPVTHLSNNGNTQWNCLSLGLSRLSLVSHLGFEPKGCLSRRGGTPAARLLFQVVQDAVAGDSPPSSPADSFIRLAVYDLLGALFAPSDSRPVSRHSDKVFTRICGVIKDAFADPDFGPCEVAAEAGISLRYVQKLFTERDSTCSEFIYSVRLDHAARLLHRRAMLGTSQPLGEIAYACGFSDYTHFARKFRQRFGYPPGAHAEGHRLRVGNNARPSR
jgi:AraC family transcriptional regulator, positive regulator of tynA and feaB